MVWDKPASDAVIKETANALAKIGIQVIIAENGEDAKEKVLKLVPKGSEVMLASSVTVDELGISKEIEEKGTYVSLRKMIRTENDEAKRHELRRRAALAQFIIGSVHAVTQDGKVLIASNSGSQLPGYAADAENVIWVVGTQKIVKDLDTAFKRLYEYTLPLENERMQKLYKMNSNPSKILIIQKEIRPNRIKLVFVKENVGF